MYLKVSIAVKTCGIDRDRKRDHCPHSSDFLTHKGPYSHEDPIFKDF